MPGNVKGGNWKAEVLDEEDRRCWGRIFYGVSQWSVAQGIGMAQVLPQAVGQLVVIGSQEHSPSCHMQGEHLWRLAVAR